MTTIDAPYIVMHATSAWYKLFNIRNSIGTYQHMYSIMSLIGRDAAVEDATGATVRHSSPIDTTAYTSSNAYVKGWKDSTGAKNKSTHQSATNALLTEMHEGYRTNKYKQVHGVLCFGLPKKKYTAEASPGGPTSASSSAKPLGHNLMCTLHVYPIFGSAAEEAPATAVATNNGDASSPQVHSLSSTKLAQSTHHRNLVSSSPMREFIGGASANLSSSVHMGATTPVYTQEPTLRRSNTQMSSTSFASTIRSSKRPEPEVPRPVYFAILFHELSEQTPVAPAQEDFTPPVFSAAPPSAGRVTTSPHGSNVTHSGSTSSRGLSGSLQSLFPKGIGRFWSRENKERDREKQEYLQVTTQCDDAAQSALHPPGL